MRTRPRRRRPVRAAGAADGADRRPRDRRGSAAGRDLCSRALSAAPACLGELCVSRGPVIPPAVLARARTHVSIKEEEESAAAVPGAVGAQPGTESPSGHQGDFLEEAVFALGLGRWFGLAGRELAGTCPRASEAHPAEGFTRRPEQPLNSDPIPELGANGGHSRLCGRATSSCAAAPCSLPRRKRHCGPAPAPGPSLGTGVLPAPVWQALHPNARPPSHRAFPPPRLGRPSLSSLERKGKTGPS